MSFSETLSNTHKPYQSTVTDQKEGREREREVGRTFKKEKSTAIGKLKKEKDRRERETIKSADISSNSMET